MSRKVAVILFPGSNCEQESKRAIESAGLFSEIVRWNEIKRCKGFAAFILPGGWSYEDRVRAGAIASHEEIMEVIKEEAAKGKPVLGICNGAQILVESGLVPGVPAGSLKSGKTFHHEGRFKDGTLESWKNKVQLALAPNHNPFVSGYYCTWVNIKKASGKKTPFTSSVDDVLPLPVAHGEGRFVSSDRSMLKKLDDAGQAIFKYCTKEGNVIDEFPVNPNGSGNSIAAICNKTGNVMAMMPHPERSSWMRQVPGMNRKGEQAGPGRKIFESLKEYLT